MAILPHVGVEYVEEDEAQGEIAELYQDIRHTLQLPIVPNGVKMLSASPASLAGFWGLFKTMVSRITLPETLVSMIGYAVAASSDCTYCAAWDELSCRTYGIDGATLDAMARNLPELQPERVRAILQFAVKVVHAPKAIDDEDFESLRRNGITDEEIVEIIVCAGVGMLHDTLADTLKVDVDALITNALVEMGAR